MVGVRKTLTASRSSVFVLLGYWRAFPLPLPTHCIRLHRTATPTWNITAPPSPTLPPPWVCPSSGIPSCRNALSLLTRDHARDAIISCRRPGVYPLWLASPLLSGSPRRVAPLAFFTRYSIYSTLATGAGYGIPWYCSISLDVPNVWCVPITQRSARVTSCP